MHTTVVLVCLALGAFAGRFIAQVEGATMFVEFDDAVFPGVQEDISALGVVITPFPCGQEHPPTTIIVASDDGARLLSTPDPDDPGEPHTIKVTDAPAFAAYKFVPLGTAPRWPVNKWK